MPGWGTPVAEEKFYSTGAWRDVSDIGDTTATCPLHHCESGFGARELQADPFVCVCALRHTRGGVRPLGITRGGLSALLKLDSAGVKANS